MCQKKYLVLFLSLFLVTSQAFCGSFGWSFLTGSKEESLTSQVKVEMPITEANEVMQKDLQALAEQEPLVMGEKSVQAVEATTTISKVEEVSLKEYLESNKVEQTKILQRLEEYEQSSILTKGNVFDQLVLDYEGFVESVDTSNQATLDLLDDYDLALKEANRMHFGIGVSGIFNINDGYSGYLDLFIRKSNAVLSIGAGYPVDLEVFNRPFEVDKINYKVGVAWEF